MYRIAFIVACLATAVAVPAHAQQPQSGSGSNIVITGQQFENKVLCKSQASTGSRFQTRVCHTNKEWADMREQSMREMNETTRNKFGDSDSLKRDTPN